MSRVGWVVALAVSLVLTACGDDGPSTPTPVATTITRAQAPSADFPAGTVLHVVEGGNETPVAGAEVVVGSERLVTEADGSFRLPSDYNDGTLVDITASGYIARQTLLRRLTGPRFSLWPTASDSGLTEEYIFDVVYHLARSGESSHMMRIRPLTDMAHVTPSEQILADPRAMRAVRDAVNELNDIARGEIVFSVNAEPPGLGIFRAHHRPQRASREHRGTGPAQVLRLEHHWRQRHLRLDRERAYLGDASRARTHVGFGSQRLACRRHVSVSPPHRGNLCAARATGDEDHARPSRRNPPARQRPRRELRANAGNRVDLGDRLLPIELIAVLNGCRGPTTTQ